MSENKVDDMQNQIIKTLEKRVAENEKRLVSIEKIHAEINGRLDVIFKLMKFIGAGVSAAIGIDIMPMMLEGEI